MQAVGPPGSAVIGALLGSMLVVSGASAQAPGGAHEARLIGKIGDVTQPESIWVGAIEVRLRKPFVLADQRSAALEFMHALAPRGREVECRLTGARMSHTVGGALVGTCVVFGPTDGREIDLGARLIERGYARPCVEPDAMIAIWPPVYDCQ